MQRSIAGERLGSGLPAIILGSLLMGGILLAGAVPAPGAVIHVPADEPTIQAAITAAALADTILIADGTYAESLDIVQDVTLTGASEAGVIIDTSSFSDYGIDVSGDVSVTLRTFTVVGPTPAAFGYGIKISGENGQITIHDVTVHTSGRSGIDLNGLVFGDLQNITSFDNGGVGLAITDCEHVTVNGITTSGNAWAGMAVYTLGTFYTGGSDDITLTGINSFGEFTGFYTETGGGFPITNLNIPPTDFSHIAGNTVVTNIIGYYPDLTSAMLAALGGGDPAHAYVMDRVTGGLVVAAGLSIQAAIDAAAPGVTLDVGAGTYVERLTIGKSLTLRGAQAGVDPTAAGARTDPLAESILHEVGLATPNPDVLVEIPAGTSGVTIDGFTLSGDPTNPVADTSTLRSFGDGITVRNNIIDGARGGLLKQGDDLTFDRNRMTANKNCLVFQAGPCTNVTISDNLMVLGGSPMGDESAVYMTSTSGAQVSGNLATGFLNAKFLAGSAVTNLSITGNTADGNKDALSFWGGSTFLTITGNTLVNSGRYGINVKGQDVTISQNIITGSGDAGIHIDQHVITTERVAIHYNTLSGNTNFGIQEQNATGTVDAELNWWGDASGPTHAGNPTGTGDALSGNVDYDPWIGKTGSENIVCLPRPLELNVAGSTGSIDVDYLGGGAGLVYAYSIRFTWDSAVISTTIGDVTQGNLLSSVGSTWFEVASTGTDEITVDCVLLGDQAGASGPGTLFSIDFTGAGCGTSPVDLTIVHVRDKLNADIAGLFAADGAVTADLVAPLFAVSAPAGGLCHGAAPALDLGASDACGDLDDAFYRLDAGAWQSDPGLFVDLAGASWANAAWTLPGFAGLGEGGHTVSFQCTDDLGNTSAIVDWTFTKDTVAPDPVSALAVAPHHDRIAVSWTNPPADFDHVVLVRKAWSAAPDAGYPLYPQPAAGYPADPTDGTIVYSGSTTTFEDTPIADRSIYFYRAFSHDCADNWNGGTAPGGDVPATFAQGGRATSYWLGDVDSDSGPGGGDYDGDVDFDDISVMSSAYWTSDPAAPQNECDVGPTDDGSRLGIPLPDGEIGFEDLMLFAMNYDVVTPAGRPAPEVLLAGGAESEQPTLRLVATPTAGATEDALVVSLELHGNTGEVQGASVELTYDASRLECIDVVASDALAGGVFFAAQTDAEGTIRIDLAALGTGRTIRGSGALAQITLARKVAGAGEVRFARAVVRDSANEPLDALREDLAPIAAAAIPAVTRLAGARPNPFNPATQVHFDLHQPGSVLLRIYDMQGRLVRTLLDDRREAGAYHVTWDGHDSRGERAGSGLYLIRMQSGRTDQTTKVVLLK